MEDNIIFESIADLHFKTRDNILVFPEVGVPRIGNFDFVMVRHRPLSHHIEDFVMIEFQTGQTTGTGELVTGFRDFMRTGNFRSPTIYNFGINHYDIWKRTFTQILSKGIVAEAWQRKIFWVVQVPIFNYFQNKYELHNLKFKNKHKTVFAVCDLQNKRGRSGGLKIKSPQWYSATVDNLFHAFRYGQEVPSQEKFIKKLNNKMPQGIKLNMQLSTD